MEAAGWVTTVPAVEVAKVVVEEAAQAAARAVAVATAVHVHFAEAGLSHPILALWRQSRARLVPQRCRLVGSQSNIRQVHRPLLSPQPQSLRTQR